MIGRWTPLELNLHPIHDGPQGIHVIFVRMRLAEQPELSLSFDKQHARLLSRCLDVSVDRSLRRQLEKRRESLLQAIVLFWLGFSNIWHIAQRRAVATPRLRISGPEAPSN